MGVFKCYPLFGRGVYHLFALIRYSAGLEIGCAAQIGVLLQNACNCIGGPSAGIVRVVISCLTGTLKYNCAWRRDLSFLEHTGDLAGAVSLGAELKDQSHIRRGFLVCSQAAILVAEVAIRRSGRNALAGHSLVAKNSAYLLAGVFRIPLVDDVPKRREIIIVALAVNAVIASDEAYTLLGKAYFRVHPDFKIVAAKPRHILDNDHAHKTILNVIQHFLKAGTVEVCPGISIVHEKQWI